MRARLLATLALATACHTSRDEHRAEVQAIAQTHAAYEEDFRRAQADFAARHPTPSRRDLGPQGLLLLHECALQGRPGQESLRVKLTWVNSTSRTLEAVRLRLWLRVAPGGAEWAEELELEVPYGLRMSAGSTHTTSLEIPLHGIHRLVGWEWGIEATALPASAGS